MTLQPIDYVNGISSLIYVAVTIVIGLIIASRYFKIKSKVYLYIGIAIMGLCEPWLPSGLSFLSNLITGSGLSLEVYVIIGNIPKIIILIIHHFFL